jgi:hypothetical protein
MTRRTPTTLSEGGPFRTQWREVGRQVMRGVVGSVKSSDPPEDWVLVYTYQWYVPKRIPGQGIGQRGEKGDKDAESKAYSTNTDEVEPIIIHYVLDWLRCFLVDRIEVLILNGYRLNLRKEYFNSFHSILLNHLFYLDWEYVLDARGLVG